MECPEVYLTLNPECGVTNPNPIRRVFFVPETGKVYDEDRNFIGFGVLKDRVLEITQEHKNQLAE